MLLLGLGGTPTFWGILGAVVPDFENLLWRRGLIPGKWRLFPGHAPWLSRYLPHGRTLGPGHVWWQVGIVCLAILVAVMNMSLRS